MEIVGISQDTAEDHKKFKDELKLPFALLSDEDREVADSFGVPVHFWQVPCKVFFCHRPRGHNQACL